MPMYPPPVENRHCLCRRTGNPMAAFLCPTGHMLECHYPYDCGEAACGHLHKYEPDAREVSALEAAALEQLATGRLVGYRMRDGLVVAIDEAVPDQAFHSAMPRGQTGRVD
jgi:hypothetical protein